MQPPPDNIKKMAEKLGFDLSIDVRIILKAKDDSRCEKDFSNWEDVYKYLSDFISKDKIK